MKTLAYCLLALAAFACGRADISVVSPENDTVANDYPDWHVLKAPVDGGITSVWGDIDKTLLISAGSAIYRSTNRGRSWEETSGRLRVAVGFVQLRDTLFSMTGLRRTTNQEALTNPSQYSVDDGKSWQPYRQYNPALDYEPRQGVVNRYLEINPIAAPNGASYRINEVSIKGYIETPGVITATGRRINLPNLHQLNSLYLDKQQRLYIAGSDAVCSRAGTGEPFAFCNSKQGRGIVYVSKWPLP